MPKIINIYIAKNFLKKFLQISLGFSLLIFFINLLDTVDKTRGGEASFYAAIEMAFLQVPTFVNDVSSSLVLISAIITFFSLSSKSEITIIRVSGFSLWQILRPIAISAFLLGIFWVIIFGPISIQMTKRFNSLESRYVQQEMREVVAPTNGIWLKQKNIENPDERLIIQAKKVYRENLELKYVTIWFFNKENQFYKKIDAKKMLLTKGSWLLTNAIINDDNHINKIEKKISIPTDLQPDFVIKKIVNDFQNIKLFSFFELPQLIQDLKSSGSNPVKFQVYFNYLLSLPFLFVAMTMIACYFGLNHIRSQNSAFMIFGGIIAGLIFYIISSIMGAFGSSGLISIFASTWIVTAICLSIGILLIYHKESF